MIPAILLHLSFALPATLAPCSERAQALHAAGDRCRAAGYSQACYRPLRPLWAAWLTDCGVRL